MIEHKLKIKGCYLNNLINGRKTFEIRENDRDYQVGDILTFSRDCLYVNKDSINIISFKITYIHSGLGLKKGYVAMSVEEWERINTPEEKG